MPCLNEKATIEACIKKTKLFITNNKIDAEILVADNGNTDNSMILGIQLTLEK